eukprot:TRINITY_DN3261_c0_g7_i2.p1 TRINITY_DN3261_c0_g7~~TRINITY_DN3261_c0_g7_i2.p1  ORF type:complete len:168 (-),score=15.68 TRINITY_DN3261_c0_g7_i2:49-552(-)
MACALRHEALGQACQVVARQTKVLGGPDSTELLRQSSQSTIIQVPAPQRAVIVELPPISDLDLVGARAAPQQAWDEHLRCLPVLAGVPQPGQRLQHWNWGAECTESLSPGQQHKHARKKKGPHGGSAAQSRSCKLMTEHRTACECANTGRGLAHLSLIHISEPTRPY